MSSSNLQKVDGGIYDIYFVVVGKKSYCEHWYSRLDISQARFVHECVLVGL
jgi:hypothetical protein